MTELSSSISVIVDISGPRNRLGYKVQVLTSDIAVGKGILKLGKTVGEWNAAASSQPAEQGSALQNLLLGNGSVPEVFYEAVGRAQKQSGERLHVLLRIDDTASELRALNWEYLPLARDDHRPFTRLYDLTKPSNPPLVALPLKMAVAIASPSDLAQQGLAGIPVGKAIQTIMHAVESLVTKGALEVTFLPGQKGLDELDADLRAKLEKPEPGWKIKPGFTTKDQVFSLMDHCHFFHFLGHGGFTDGVARLYLETTTGETDNDVTETVLCDRLGPAAQKPYLIFLSACESASLDAETDQAFMGLGPKLIESGIPAVVAMQNVVELFPMLDLSKYFYEKLLEDGMVDLALNYARRQIYNPRSTVWAPPVLFGRLLEEGQLFRYKQTEQIAHPVKGLPDLSQVNKAQVEAVPPSVASGPPPAITDLFNIVHTSDATLTNLHLLLEAKNKDWDRFNVQYVDPKEHSDSDGEQPFIKQVKKELLAAGGALLIHSEAGLGKTRTLAELADHYRKAGWLVCVAKDEADSRLGRISKPANEFLGERFLVLVDNLQRRLDEASTDIGPYVDRLQEFRVSLAGYVGGETRVFIVATIAAESQVTEDSKIDLRGSSWKKLRLFAIPEWSDPSLEKLLLAMANHNKISIDPSQARHFIENSDRRPKTLDQNVTTAIRKMQSELTESEWNYSMDGSLDELLLLALGRDNCVEDVFDSLQLLHSATLTARPAYVASLSTQLARSRARNCVETSDAIENLRRMRLLHDDMSGQLIAETGLLNGLLDRHRTMALTSFAEHWEMVVDSVLEANKDQIDWWEDLVKLSERLMSDDHVMAVKMVNAVTDSEEQEKLARRCYEKAAKLASAIIDHREDNYIGYYLRGCAHFSMDDFKAAETDFVRAVDLRQEDPWPLVYLGFARIKCGMTNEAENDLRKAYEIAEEYDATVLLFAASSLLQDQYLAQFYPEARNLLGRAIRSEKADQKVKSISYFYLARLSIQEKDYKQVEVNCTQAIKYETSTPGIIYSWRAWARQNQKDFTGAEEDYRKAIDLGEGSAANYLELGKVRLSQAKLVDAVDAFDSAIAISKKDANAYYNRGNARARLEQWEMAIADYTEVVKLDPHFIGILERRGRARLQIGNFAAAAADYTRALKPGPDNNDTFYDSIFVRAWARFLLGDYVTALKDAREATKRDPTELGAYELHLWCSLSLNQLKQARAIGQHITELEPSGTTDLGSQGALSLAMGDFESAVRKYVAALEAGKGSNWHFELGLAQLLAGSLDESRTSYDSGISEGDRFQMYLALRLIELWTARHIDRIAELHAEGIVEELRAKLLEGLTIPK